MSTARVHDLVSRFLTDGLSVSETQELEQLLENSCGTGIFDGSILIELLKHINYVNGQSPRSNC